MPYMQAPAILPSLTSLTPSDAWRAIGLGIGTILWYAGFLAIPAVTYIAGIAVWSWLNAAYLVFLLGHLLWYNAGLAPPPKAALLPFAKVHKPLCCSNRVQHANLACTSRTYATWK